MKKKIVFFDFVTHFGGAQQCTALLCSKLRKSFDVYVIDPYGFCEKYTRSMIEYGIELSILVPNAKKVYIGSKGKPFKRMWNSIKQLPTFLILRKRFIRQIVELNPSAIWTNSVKSLLFLNFSWRLRKYPMIMYAHTWFKREELSALDRWLIKKADAVFAVSNATAQALQSWGVKRDKIFIVYHAIDFDQIRVNSKTRISSPLPGQDKNLKLLVPGQLVRTKGQHAAIEVARILKEKDFDFVMWVVGDQKVGDENYSVLLQELINRYQLQQNAFLLGWRDDMAALMKLSQFVIVPTHTEGLGKVIEEAMLLMRPVISTPAGGVTDLIIDGQTGLLGPIDDAKAIVRNLEKLISEETLASQIRKEANKNLCEKFCIEKHVALVSSAFEQIIVSQ